MASYPAISAPHGGVRLNQKTFKLLTPFGGDIVG